MWALDLEKQQYFISSTDTLYMKKQSFFLSTFLLVLKFIVNRKVNKMERDVGLSVTGCNFGVLPRNSSSCGLWIWCWIRETWGWVLWSFTKTQADIKLNLRGLGMSTVVLPSNRWIWSLVREDWGWLYLAWPCGAPGAQWVWGSGHWTPKTVNGQEYLRWVTVWVGLVKTWRALIPPKKEQVSKEEIEA